MKYYFAEDQEKALVLLKKIATEEGLTTQRMLARELGVSTGLIAQALSGKDPIRKWFLEKVCSKFGEKFGTNIRDFSFVKDIKGGSGKIQFFINKLLKDIKSTGKYPNKYRIKHLALIIEQAGEEIKKL
ncbi:hypothetical protein COV49_02140 [Candidatus Falkowbacteria bacterium CG11_big_fil_rev_8_21_14_0_20_39_10]|uniref:HTH cro/C1-type domain-containing protein n=1 Tax=Candidatus Falkowbacteria bacterium CG11_big_fil_rev_8_21_14_0_20_39_10 TaxID=1974570 RepID=A0A2M6K9C7_9BACT|nr:MAG: hypothetical protein COV49_02140 [Candidatus Falkowbacteria bacterium CG11_big_fil_rev_8_21_14_0_20_39_10]